MQAKRAGKDGAGAGGDKPSKGIDSWLLAAGIQEAESIYREAHEFALQLTRTRLNRNFNIDRSWAAAADPVDADTGSPDGHSGSQSKGGEELVRVLQLRGASDSTGEAIIGQLKRTNSPYLNGKLLCAKLEQLEHLLPGVDIVKLLVRDPLLLELDLYRAVQNMVILSDRLPGVDLMEAVCSCPGLLGCSELESRLDRVVRKLKTLLPQWKRPMLEQLIEENSVLIFRLDMHLDKSFSELPMDIQNMLAVGGGGGGGLFRSWKPVSPRDQTKD